ncbi:hypothetical protein [Polluticaenibacter yanchengensis]|uniref:Uncharacterized protein n=1 Tax=Polluticaenibacter yanchengensis TaxID=3014562 RepID=A0ABT4UHZ3_9BACT|nr:hypothetical protein [Chitinophagaceae bacterium LY-5]
MLLVILSMTFLPIKEVGKLLSSNQLVEELSPEVHENKPLNNFGNEVIHFHTEFSYGNNLYKTTDISFIQLTDNIPSHPSVEIHVPPPNC